MRRNLGRLWVVLVAALAVTACSSAGPGWTYVAAPPAPSAAPVAQAGDATAAPSPAGSAPATAGMPGMMLAASSPAPAASPLSAPSAAPAASAAPYVLRDPNAPPLLPGTVHDVALPITEANITVAPGHVVHAWTFGGTVPGPTIRVKVGDTVRVHLTNNATMPHSIDFHASQTAMDDQMVEIQPGATWTYTFKAEYAGVWMYHCGSPPALWHIANGMFGMVMVEPKAGLPKVDRELALVQSEWYLGANGQPADYTKAAAANPAPDYVVFNGVANQYKDNPIAVKAGDRIRVFVLDAGPNEDSSFHVVGTIFDAVRKEGVALLAGNDGNWGSQAVDLAPAQAAIVEFTIPENGSYSFVTHAFNFVGLGAVGVLKAGNGAAMSH